MSLLDKLIFKKVVEYTPHPEAVIISCYFNSEKNPYRLKNFNKFYERIKNTHHAIYECAIGEADFELPETKNIQRIRTESLLWHKEALLNKIISELPEKFKYVFWVDADVTFTNPNWIVEGVEQFELGANIIQPFEYAVHLEKDEIKPSLNLQYEKDRVSDPSNKAPDRRVWRSFAANQLMNQTKFARNTYDLHGHVGFAWGAKREVLDKVPLYDHALVGGADHIMAHAAVGEIPHECIKKSFTDNLKDIEKWSKKFFKETKGKIGFVSGDVYHLWHGDINKRQYLKRVQEFTPINKSIKKKDRNGLYVAPSEKTRYVQNYFQTREVTETRDDNFTSGFILGSLLNSGHDHDHHHHHRDSAEDFSSGAGGSFGGGGASGSWNNDSSDTNENFS